MTSPVISSAILRVLAALLLVPASLALGAGAPTAAADPTAADPMAGAPAVGSCYDVDWRAASRPALQADPVDCAAAHTLRVVAVRRLPARLSWDDPRRQVLAAAVRVCVREYVRAVGGTPKTRLLTLYSAFIFIPSKAQREAGARWVNCSIGMLDETGMVALPPGELPRATRRPADSVAACMTGRYRIVVCTEPHRWRARKAFLARATGSRKEQVAAGRAAAERRCGRLVGSETYAWYLVPWSRHQIAVVCSEWDAPRP